MAAAGCSKRNAGSVRDGIYVVILVDDVVSVCAEQCGNRYAGRRRVRSLRVCAVLALPRRAGPRQLRRLPISPPTLPRSSSSAAHLSSGHSTTAHRLLPPLHSCQSSLFVRPPSIVVIIFIALHTSFIPPVTLGACLYCLLHSIVVSPPASLFLTWPQWQSSPAPDRSRDSPRFQQDPRLQYIDLRGPWIASRALPRDRIGI